MKRISRFLAVPILVMLGCSDSTQPDPESGTTPRLLLFVTVDQLRYDYLQRLEGDLPGGLGRLLREGVSFDSAYHGHAITTTGPGHASLATGTYPRRSGIVDNQWFDRDTKRLVNCVEDREVQTLGSSLPGRSPRQLLVDTVADWMKSRDPAGKVFAASRKDRGAILPAGRKADGAFWYDSGTGRFVTSSYYMSGYPRWVDHFHRDHGPERFFGQAWEPLTTDPELGQRARFEALDAGAFAHGFPHSLGGLSLSPDSRFFSDFGTSPLMDGYLVEFVESLVIAEELGSDDRMDFLGVSFSALDSVGHEFGPNSPEALDALLRLDEALGRLLGFLEQRVGEEGVWVVLSADHGVVPLPEFQAAAKLPGQRVRTQDVLCHQRAGRALQARLGPLEGWVEGLYLDRRALQQSGRKPAQVEEWFSAELEKCEPVQKVWTRAELEPEPPPGDLYRRLYHNSFHPQRSADLLVQWREYWLASGGRGTTHGSPYSYDRHVPLILRLPGVAPQRITQPVETVDLAPTLWALLGLPPQGRTDGRDLSPLLLEARPGPVEGELLDGSEARTSR